MKRCFAILLRAVSSCGAGFAEPPPRRGRSAVALPEANRPSVMPPTEKPSRADATAPPPADGLPESSTPVPEQHETSARRAEERSFWRALMRAFSPWPI